MNSHSDAIDMRQLALRQWLNDVGYTITALEPASADASFRRYFRITLDNAGTPDRSATLIAMDAPPDKEDSAPFVRVAELMQALSVPVPTIHDRDLEQGFLVLDDLGSTDLLTALGATPEARDALYSEAMHWLRTLQCASDLQARENPAYDDALLRREMALFEEWLIGKHLKLPWSGDDQANWRMVTDILVRNALSQPSTLVHRDFHSRNLMVRDDDSIAIIDFQDAMYGPYTYDLVSLLRDCYVALPPTDVRALAEDWLALSPHGQGVDSTQRLRWFDLMGVQRHLKAAGIFARLAHRDNKWGYLPDIPRTVGYIIALRTHYPELEWLTTLLEERVLPELAT
ncbi:MAG: phosphotransferase [Pseudomonadota bacterium]